MQAVIKLRVGANRSQTRANGALIILPSVPKAPDRLRFGSIKGTLALFVRLAFSDGGEVFDMRSIHGNKF